MQKPFEDATFATAIDSMSDISAFCGLPCRSLALLTCCPLTVSTDSGLHIILRTA